MPGVWATGPHGGLCPRTRPEVGAHGWHARVSRLPSRGWVAPWPSGGRGWPTGLQPAAPLPLGSQTAPRSGIMVRP
eukprot:1828609-Alexandrium_andersonii.AAC.1